MNHSWQGDPDAWKGDRRRVYEGTHPELGLDYQIRVEKGEVEAVIKYDEDRKTELEVENLGWRVDRMLDMEEHEFQRYCEETISNIYQTLQEIFKDLE